MLFLFEAYLSNYADENNLYSIRKEFDVFKERLRDDFKTIVNLFSYGKKKILVLYENHHYMTSYKKDCFFLNIYFSLYHDISVFISL